MCTIIISFCNSFNTPVLHVCHVHAYYTGTCIIKKYYQSLKAQDEHSGYTHIHATLLASKMPAWSLLLFMTLQPKVQIGFML